MQSFMLLQTKVNHLVSYFIILKCDYIFSPLIPSVH